MIDEALAAKETGEERVILFNYSGHGLLDLVRLRRLPQRPAARRAGLMPGRPSGVGEVLASTLMT